MQATRTPAPFGAQQRLGKIEPLLREVVADLEPELDDSASSGPGRPRILPAMALWSGLVVCLARGFSSQLDLWRVLSQQGLWDYPRYPVSDQAVYKRLESGGTAPLETLFQQVSSLLAERLEPDRQLAPFAGAVVALDATVLDPVLRKLPHLQGREPRPLGGQLATVFDLRLQQFRQVVYRAHAFENEKVAAREAIAALEPGTLILADLGYFSFRWFDEVSAAGHWWISQFRAGTSYTVEHTFYQQGQTRDALVWLGAHRSYHAGRLVRLIEFQRGRQRQQYLTNVLDPGQLPLGEVAGLYTRRWDIESAFKLLKRELGLHLLWSGKPVVIQQQVWAALIVAQIVLALRQEVAQRAGVELFAVSLPLLLRWMPRYAAQGQDPLAAMVEQGRAAGFIRPPRRVQVRSPAPDLCQYLPAPDDLVQERLARYGTPVATN